MGDLVVIAVEVDISCLVDTAFVDRQIHEQTVENRRPRHLHNSRLHRDLGRDDGDDDDDVNDDGQTSAAYFLRPAGISIPQLKYASMQIYAKEKI